jgi:hypothetical protein
MKLYRLAAIVLANAATYSMLGCGNEPTSTPAASTAAPTSRVVEAEAAFSLSTRTPDHLSGSLGIAGRSVTFDVRVGLHDAVRAELRDDLGNVVTAVVLGDGTRHVSYNHRRISVRPDGSVDAEAFALLPTAMRRALGIVPLDLACDAPDADARMMEAAALPFNILQRSLVRVPVPQDLMRESKCVAPGAESATSSVAHEVLVRSKIVVAPRRGT